MAKKHLMTQKDVSRIQSSEAKKNNGIITKASYVTRLQKTVSTRTKK